MVTDIASGFLFTDHYQLTMAQLYFRSDLHTRPSQFEHFFRSYNQIRGKRFDPKRRLGVEDSLQLVRDAARARGSEGG